MSVQSDTHVAPQENAGRAGRRAGQISELTVIAPLKEGGAERLRAKLANRDVGGAFAEKVGTLHNSRFVIFDDDTRLLFATAYDGDWDTYIADFVRLIPEVLDHFFSELEGWPGIHDPAVADYIVDHQVTAEYWYVAYPDARVQDLLHGQRLTKAFDDLLDAAQQ
ncbi:MAG: hypothetical protein ACLPUG_12315 [Acidimicrobiales bacterium]